MAPVRQSLLELVRRQQAGRPLEDPEPGPLIDRKPGQWAGEFHRVSIDGWPRGRSRLRFISVEWPSWFASRIKFIEETHLRDQPTAKSIGLDHDAENDATTNRNDHRSRSSLSGKNLFSFDRIVYFHSASEIQGIVESNDRWYRTRMFIRPGRSRSASILLEFVHRTTTIAANLLNSVSIPLSPFFHPQSNQRAFWRFIFVIDFHRINKGKCSDYWTSLTSRSNLILLFFR